VRRCRAGALAAYKPPETVAFRPTTTRHLLAPGADGCSEARACATWAAVHRETAGTLEELRTAVRSLRFPRRPTTALLLFHHIPHATAVL